MGRIFVFPIYLFLLINITQRVCAELTFPESFIKIANSGLTFYFEFNETNKTILMGLEMNQIVDYYAVGFADKGNFGMTTFDIVCFVFIPNNDTQNTYSVSVLDLYSFQNKRPPTDEALGGTSDYKLIASYVTPQKVQVLFERAWDTGDIYDYQFDPDVVKNGIVMDWAWVKKGKFAMTYHRDTRGTVLSKMYNGFKGEARNYYPSMWDSDAIFMIHGYMMLFTWAILIEIVIQFGRYMKYGQYYVIIHTCLAILVYIITVGGSLFTTVAHWGQIGAGLQLLHFYLGLVIVILSTFQTVFGFALRSHIKSHKPTDNIQPLSRFHFAFGVLIYLIAKGQLVLGLHLYKPVYVKYLLIFYGVNLIARILQEYSYSSRASVGGKWSKGLDKPDSTLEKHQHLLQHLNNSTPVNEILSDWRLQGLKWSILDNKVFEIKNFTHPGGNFIFDYIHGREIGRFMYGAYGIEFMAGQTQHHHSKQALKVIKKNFIGTVDYGQTVLVPIYDIEEESSPGLYPINKSKRKKSWGILNIKKMAEATLRLTGRNGPQRHWTLERRTNINHNVAKFEFLSEDFYVDPSIRDIKHLGRHMKVSHISQAKVRLYSLVLSQTEYRIRKRKLLWKQFKNADDLITTSNQLGLSRSETLPLIIKRYDVPNMDMFSRLIHDSHQNRGGFVIEGPFGVGLGLTEATTGLHYIFAAGTGIFPFLDLFDYLFEDVLEYKNAKSIFKYGFKLHIYASFTEFEDFIGLDICKKIVRICKTKKYEDAFKITIRARNAKESEFYSVTEDSFDDLFIEENLNFHCEKVYVCGPPVFNLQIPISLELFGIPKDKIVLV